LGFSLPSGLPPTGRAPPPLGSAAGRSHRGQMNEMRWLQIWLQAAGGRPRPAGTGAWSSQARQSQTGSSQCLPRRANAADARAACRPRNEHHHQPPAWATAGHGGSSRIMRSRASEIPAASSHRAHVRACATHRMRAGAGGPCVRGMMVARSMLSLVALRAAACAAAAYPLSCPASPAARSIHPRPPPQLFHIGSIAPRRDKLCGGHHPTATCHCHCLFRSLLPPKSFGIAPPPKPHPDATHHHPEFLFHHWDSHC
jgi:hypothetical protein